MKIEEMYGTVEETAPARQAPATAGMPMIKKESMGKKAMPPPTVSENAVVQDVAKRASEAEAASPFPFQNVADIAAQLAGSPVAQTAAAALLGGYAYKKGSEIIGESKAKKGLSDRLFNTQGRVEPSMATGAQPSPLAPTNQFPGTPQELEKALGPNWQKAMQQSDELRRQRQAQAQIEINKQMGMPNATVGQTTENIAPVLDQSSQTPMEDIKPVEELKEDIKPTEQTEKKQKNKPGPKIGSTNRTAEQIAADEATKGINMYRNLFGFDKKNPDSPKSLAAIESTNRFITEGFGGKLPASRDPLLDPGDFLTSKGKKFYSGLPEGYRNVYVPWIEQNLNTLPPETQSHLLQSRTIGQTKDMTKLLSKLGLAGAALSAYETGFAKTPTERAKAGVGLMEAVLPPGLSPGELQPGTLGPEQLRAFQEAQKLGSPFRAVPPPR